MFPVISGLNPRKDDAKFLEFSKGAEGGPSREGSRSKMFPEVPVFRKSCGNPESGQNMVLGLGKVEGLLGTWFSPELLVVSGSKKSVAPDMEFTLLCSVPGNYGDFACPTKFAHCSNLDLCSPVTQTLQHLQLNRCLALVSLCRIKNLDSTMWRQCWLTECWLPLAARR